MLVFKAVVRAMLEFFSALWCPDSVANSTYICTQEHSGTCVLVLEAHWLWQKAFKLCHAMLDTFSNEQERPKFLFWLAARQIEVGSPELLQLSMLCFRLDKPHCCRDDPRNLLLPLELCFQSLEVAQLESPEITLWTPPHPTPALPHPEKC